MNHLPFHTAHHWITQLTQLPHPITINHIPPLAAELNWEPTERPGAYLYHHGSDSPIVQLSIDKETQVVFSISFRVASNRTKTLLGSIEVADIYSKFTQQAISAWGTPSDFSCNSTSFIWKFHEHAYVQLYNRPNEAVILFDRIDPYGPE